MNTESNQQSDATSGGPGPAPDKPRKLSIWQIISSTIAAAFGVQSSRNRERDFAAGKPSHFIIAGIVFTVVFVIGMILLVRLVLSAAS
jgi:hypothetical protein